MNTKHFIIRASNRLKFSKNSVNLTFVYFIILFYFHIRFNLVILFSLSIYLFYLVCLYIYLFCFVCLCTACLFSIRPREPRSSSSQRSSSSRGSMPPPSYPAPSARPSSQPSFNTQSQESSFYNF